MTHRATGYYWAKKRAKGQWQLWYCDNGYWKRVPFVSGGWPESLQDFAEVSPRVEPPNVATNGEG